MEDWYSLYKIGNELVDEKYRIADVERISLLRRRLKRESSPRTIDKFRTALISLVPNSIRYFWRER